MCLGAADGKECLVKMKKLIKKVQRRLKNTYRTFKNDCLFSKKLAFIRVLYEYTSLLHLGYLSSKLKRLLDDTILKYLIDFLQPIINEYSQKISNGIKENNASIWICWWTGEETAPLIVKQCVRSIRQNAQGHRVCFIDQFNYNDYIDIPSYILDKVNRKEMCLANFSDYLRFALLNKYGGLWLDTTVFCSQEIPQDYFNLPLFTCKKNQDSNNYISKYRWTSFCFGGWKNHILFSFFQKSFEYYWEKHHTSIDYLLVDYLIDIAYEHFPLVKQNINEIPFNNLAIDDLRLAMNRSDSSKRFKEVVQSDTVIYKLSWREDYSLTTCNGGDSIYKYFIEMPI